MRHIIDKSKAFLCQGGLRLAQVLTILFGLMLIHSQLTLNMMRLDSRFKKETEIRYMAIVKYDDIDIMVFLLLLALLKEKRKSCTQ